MSWEQNYLELRLQKQISVHDSEIEANDFIQGLSDLFAILKTAALAGEAGAKMKLADFAVEYLNVARSVYQGGPSYKTIKERVIAEVGEVK